ITSNLHQVEDQRIKACEMLAAGSFVDRLMPVRAIYEIDEWCDYFKALLRQDASFRIESVERHDNLIALRRGEGWHRTMRLSDRNQGRSSHSLFHAFQLQVRRKAGNVIFAACLSVTAASGFTAGYMVCCLLSINRALIPSRKGNEFG